MKKYRTTLLSPPLLSPPFFLFFFFLFFSLLKFILLPAFPAQLYSMADLEVLKDNKSYEEFFKHAKDIIPTKRDQYWREMLSSMAMNYVDEKRHLQDYAPQVFKSINKLSSWAQLKKDEFFQIKRNAYGLSYLKNCFSSRPKKECQKTMRRYWKTAYHDLETSVAMAKLHYGFFPAASGIDYLSAILFQQGHSFSCQKEMISTIFTSYLETTNLYQIQGSKPKDYFLASLIGDSCWKKMVPNLRKSLLSAHFQKDPEQQRNLFLSLSLRKELSTEESSLWLIRYYLSSPPQGELLNLSWNQLKELGQNYKRRMALLQKLQQLDPLPGKILKSLDGKKTQILVKHLRQNFPEYLSLYAKSCLSYLEGQRTYPFGNPTPQCHLLFQKAMKVQKGKNPSSPILPPSLIQRYRQALGPRKSL